MPDTQQEFNKDKWDEKRKGGRDGGRILTPQFPSTMLWQHYQWVHTLNSADIGLVFLNHLLHTPPLTTSFFLKHLFPSLPSMIRHLPGFASSPSSFEVPLPLSCPLCINQYFIGFFSQCSSLLHLQTLLRVPHLLYAFNCQYICWWLLIQVYPWGKALMSFRPTYVWPLEYLIGTLLQHPQKNPPRSVQA